MASGCSTASNRRVDLTATGAQFAEHARRIEAQFNLAEEAMKQGQPEAIIRLGVLSTIPTGVIAAIAQALGADRRHPHRVRRRPRQRAARPAERRADRHRHHHRAAGQAARQLRARGKRRLWPRPARRAPAGRPQLHRRARTGRQRHAGAPPLRAARRHQPALHRPRRPPLLRRPLPQRRPHPGAGRSRRRRDGDAGLLQPRRGWCGCRWRTSRMCGLWGCWCARRTRCRRRSWRGCAECWGSGLVGSGCSVTPQSVDSALS